MSVAVTSNDASETGATVAATAAAPSRPWWWELGSVVPRSVYFAARAARPRPDQDVPSLPVNPLSWATIAVDELAVTGAYLLSRRGAEHVVLERLAAADAAVEVLADAGMLADPGALYPAPASPVRVRITDRDRRGSSYEHISFASAFTPPDGLAELTDWDVPDNERVHAYLLRHGDRPRPWALVIHGHRMGEARDLRMLGSTQLHHDLGLDVAHLVLPMHGPRGRHDGHPFPGVDPVANLLGATQSVSDSRSLLAWIRTQTDQPIGVFGVSLGGLVAGLLAGFDGGLAAVVVGVPLVDMASMLAGTVRSRWGSSAVEHAHLLDAAPVALSRLASPLTFPPEVAAERRFVYAAIGDRLVTARQAELLWRHWDRPTVQWLHGGHLINNVRASRRFVARAFTSTGVTSRY